MPTLTGRLSKTLLVSVPSSISPRLPSVIGLSSEARSSELTGVLDAEAQSLIWDFYKPRHTHSWNMLVLSWRALDQFDTEPDTGFEIEYLWENFIIRLWLYRTTVRTLTKLTIVKDDAENALEAFDGSFCIAGTHGLKAIRDMIEHFDDYAAGVGRGPAVRDKHLDPWRIHSKEHYERGDLRLDRMKSYKAADKLRADAKTISDKFVRWYKSKVSGSIQ